MAHRRRILDAAEAVFAEHGVTAPLDLVVRRAGVGRATFYRNFADRKALMEALLERALLAYENYIAEHAGRPDVLWLALDYAADQISGSLSALADYWRAMPRDDPFIAAVLRRHSAIYRRPLQRCIEAGLCRPDLRPTDFTLVVQMLSSALRGRSLPERRRLARRGLDLLKRGLTDTAA